MKLEKRRMRYRLATVLAMAGLCISPALAQQDEREQQGQRNRNQQQDDQQQQRRDQRDQNQRDQSQRDQNQRDQNQRGQNQRDRSQQGDQQQAQFRLQPEGWVSMAVDYNNDGTYDSVETIYIYDLQTARERSRDRRGGSNGQMSDRFSQNRQDRGAQRGQDNGRMSADRQDQKNIQRMVSGEIDQLRKIRLRDNEQPCVVARVRTDEGRTARILLGTQQQLSRLDLQPGDRISVRGRVGRVNDRSLLVANQVRSGDQQVRVEFKQGQRPLRQYRGNVTETRTAQFRGHDGEFLIGRMQREGGGSDVVNLGPKNKFSGVDVKNAEEVCILASKGRINGREALIAEEVSIDGETFKVKPDEMRDQRWSSESSQRQQSTQNSRSTDRNSPWEDSNNNDRR